ncbi:MAG: hypothetical protein IJ467_03435, partial [Bacteroidaceae bacterium]|nr:hypothetical protein [Bacteroidaceae bacterium]
MISSKDLEKIWETYQKVAKTQNISIVDYCQYNGIVYSRFQNPLTINRGLPLVKISIRQCVPSSVKQP